MLYGRVCSVYNGLMFMFCRILWKKNEVADYEATTFSIFYNNALYLVLLIVVSFYLLKNFNPNVYPFLKTKTNYMYTYTA